jgi:formamidopyrimidine-DNA glycosylase
MPELPEVETITRDLNKKVLGRTFIDVWTDWAKIIKKPKSFDIFRKEIKGKKIKEIERRGKNILFRLSEEKTLLIHQKLTGHLLLGRWEKGSKGWMPEKAGPLKDPVNRFLHLIFWLDNNEQLALSDLRKFAKVELGERQEIENSKEIKNLGPDPLGNSFTFLKFEEILRQTQGRPRKGKIKKILMDQTIISGIGNIYSDEILWWAKIHPFKDVLKLSQADLKKIFHAMKKILSGAIKLGGESISDFRRLSGERGYFDKERKVYRREGEKCGRCGAIIKRLKIGGRSVHFCPNCQRI